MPVDPARACFLYPLDQGAAGIYYHDKKTNRKQLYLSFDPVNLIDTINNNRYSWFSRIYEWLQSDFVESGVSKDQVPDNFSVMHNFPNPFNPSTTIHYYLPHAGIVNMNIYNSRGQKVVTLFNGKRTAGAHTVRWDGKNEQGREMSSGVYLLQIFFENQTQSLQNTLKMIKLK